MKSYSKKYYKPANETYWEWSDSVDTMKGDCDPGEHIEVGRDEKGWYYQFVREVEE